MPTLALHIDCTMQFQLFLLLLIFAASNSILYDTFSDTVEKDIPICQYLSNISIQNCPNAIGSYIQ